MAEFSEADWEIIVAATHTGMSTEEFIEIVDAMVAYLCANEIETYIPSDRLAQRFTYAASLFTERVVGSLSETTGVSD